MLLLLVFVVAVFVGVVGDGGSDVDDVGDGVVGDGVGGGGGVVVAVFVVVGVVVDCGCC